MGNTFHIRRHIVIRNRSERFGTRSGEFPAKEAWMRLTDGQVNRQEIHLDKIRKLCIVYHIFCFESSFFQSKLYMKPPKLDREGRSDVKLYTSLCKNDGLPGKRKPFLLW